MRNISFFLTTPQFLNGTKDVTRRIGWANLKPGELLQAVEKGQGLKAGQKATKLGVIRVKSVRREQLFKITQEDVVREGFPDMLPGDFIRMFEEHNDCDARDVITRIEFEHVKETNG